MFQNILGRMADISIYGVISICIFFGFFTGMLLWAAVQKRSHLNQMGALPLDGGELKKETNEPNPR